MPHSTLANFVLLPELKLLKIERLRKFQSLYHCRKERRPEACPRCATLCHTVYDSRKVLLEDAPVRGFGITLKVTKRRLFCKRCKKPFTEPLAGVMPRRRSTQRFRRSVAWAAENFSDLKRVQKAYRCSNDFIYKALYEQLELRRRERNDYPFPTTLGIDEHHFRRCRGGSEFRPRAFVTMFVDYDNKKLFEVSAGKTREDLTRALFLREGRENVRRAIIDMSDSYRSFIAEFFPNAEIVADKFHVLRLITPTLNRRRKEITGDKRNNPVRKLLLRNNHSLKFFEKSALQRWLAEFPELAEIYSWKEKLHAFYRIHGFERAKRALTHITDEMSKSILPEIKTLRRTLMRWRNEILNYFKHRLTNARTEAYNNVAKVIKRRSYGFKNFENYRLRLLNACS